MFAKGKIFGHGQIICPVQNIFLIGSWPGTIGFDILTDLDLVLMSSGVMQNIYTHNFKAVNLILIQEQK